MTEEAAQGGQGNHDLNRASQWINVKQRIIYTTQFFWTLNA